MSDALPTPPTLADGRYVLRERIGSGAMSIVYRARDTRLGMSCAVKVLAVSEDADRATVAARMQAEARAMAQIHHPHVVRLHDIGEDNGRAYLVMDLAHTSLRRRVDQMGAVPSHQAVRWMVQVLSALAVAHSNGVVHRDVKPENILLDVDDRALLTDFGVALLTDLRQTQTGVALGSLAFMPPEQRLDASRVTHLADIYAVGATTYALVTGQNPSDLFLAGRESARWSSVHPGLAAVLQRACAREPADRYSTAGDFARALRQVHPMPTTGAFPSPSLAFQARPEGSRGEGDTLMPGPETPRGIAAVALAGVLTVAMIGLATLLPRPTPLQPAPVPADAVHGSAVAPPIAWVGPERPPRAPTPASAGEGPARTPTPRPAPAADPSRLQGMWDASHNGVRVTLALRGSEDALRGEVVSRLGPKVHAAAVTGRYDAAARRLRLDETDGEVHYDIELSADLAEGRGVVEETGFVRPLHLRRSTAPPRPR